MQATLGGTVLAIWQEGQLGKTALLREETTEYLQRKDEFQMAFNAAAVRVARQTKNSQARVNRFQGGNKAPFIRPRDLLDGTYPLRPWPAEPTKNPLGYLFEKKHTIRDVDAPDFNFSCPRSSNWDPTPTHWENEKGEPVAQELVDRFMDPDREAEEGDPFFYPVFAERCWGCEVESSIADSGLKLENFSKHLQEWLNGDWSTGFKGLFGDENYNFPATMGIKEHTRVAKESAKGKKYDEVTYCPDPSARVHCILQLSPGELLNDLLLCIQQCPDCSNIQVGRWFSLRKANGGQGVGGYKLMMQPHPSPAGFEISSKDYPNFQSWGKGNPKYNRPSTRIPYSEVEAIGSHPSKWWVEELTKHGIVLADDYGDGGGW